jgi:hypothetical protein
VKKRKISSHYYENVDCGQTEKGVIKCIRVIKESDDTCILVALPCLVVAHA